MFRQACTGVFGLWILDWTRGLDYGPIGLSLAPMRSSTMTPNQLCKLVEGTACGEVEVLGGVD